MSYKEVLIINNKSFKDFAEDNLNSKMFVTSIFSVIIGILVNSLSTSISVPFYIFGGYIIISIFIYWFQMLIILNKGSLSSNYLELKLIRFNRKNNSLTCILDSCDFISIDAFLTFYYIDNSIEIYLATGKIINIQSNKLISVNILDIESTTDYCNEITNNNIDFINNIIVKPIVTNNYLSERSV